jgi:transcriptional regulator with XRE-family HTH domain
MELKKLKEKLLSNKKFREEYYRKDLAVEIGEMVVDARVKLGLTQTELADLVGTQQPSIARLENGDRIPDLKFLERIAKSLGAQLVAPKFVFSVHAGSVVKMDRPTARETIRIRYMRAKRGRPGKKDKVVV